MAGPGGHYYIKKCLCGALEKFEPWHYMSFGGWTDGKPNSMLPKGKMPYVTKCSKCGKYNMPRHQEQVGEYGAFYNPPNTDGTAKPEPPEEWRLAPECVAVPDSEIVVAARVLAQTYPAERFGLYITALHVINEPRRVKPKTNKDNKIVAPDSIPDIEEKIKALAYEISAGKPAACKHVAGDDPLANWLKAESLLTEEHEIPPLPDDCLDIVYWLIDNGMNTEDKNSRMLSNELLRETGKFGQCIDRLKDDPDLKFIGELAKNHRKGVYTYVHES